MSELRQAVKPERRDLVRDYPRGRYLIFKKWLSYRDSKALSRGLELVEVDWFSEVARRIAGILWLSEVGK